jgi:hypothetical protein
MTLVVRAIVANALTSRAADWSNNIGPVLGCTVAANGNQVTIDSVIPSGESIPITAGTFNAGVHYRIVFQGTTIWTGIGAGSNNLGTVFQANGAGTGTGQAVAITTITTAAAGTAVAGGGFTLSAAIAFSADVRGGSTTCLTITGSNSYTLSAARVVGGSSANALGINHTGSGLILANSACTFNGGTGATAHGAVVNGSGAILRLDAALDVRGSALGSSCGVNVLVGSVEVQNNSVVNGGGGGAAHGILGAAGTAITINNSTVNGGPSASTGNGVSSAGSVSGANNVFNAIGSEALNVSGNGVINITASQWNASATIWAVTATSATVIHTIGGTRNSRPSAGNPHAAWNVRRFNLAVGSHQETCNASDNTALIMYSPDGVPFGNPPTADVRAGVTYGPGGALTGTFAQTISPTLTQIGSGVWSADARTLTEKTGFGLTSAERTAISDRVERSGGMLDLKLSASAYTSPPAAADNATAVRDEIERTGGMLASRSTLTAAQVWAASDRTLSAGAAVEIGSTSVTAISTQLERTGGPLSLKLDAAAYTAPANADILAIKAVTDLLNTARLSSVPTEDFLLQVISQWLSAPS